VPTNELVDLVDAQGVPRIHGIPRSRTRERHDDYIARGLYLPIVIVVVVDRHGRILAHTREGTTDHPGEIDHVCGAVTSGETWEDAARREAVEELGVRLHGVTLVHQGINAYHRHRTLVASTTTDPPHTGEGSTVVAATLGDLRRMRGPFVRQFFTDVEDAFTRLLAASM
jgi:8-oxo-dGTP pyrophosphatase MutT (NUDIX family)